MDLSRKKIYHASLRKNLGVFYYNFIEFLCIQKSSYIELQAWKWFSMNLFNDKPAKCYAGNTFV